MTKEEATLIFLEEMKAFWWKDNVFCSDKSRAENVAEAMSTFGLSSKVTPKEYVASNIPVSYRIEPIT